MISLSFVESEIERDFAGSIQSDILLMKFLAVFGIFKKMILSHVIKMCYVIGIEFD